MDLRRADAPRHRVARHAARWTFLLAVLLPSVVHAQDTPGPPANLQTVPAGSLVIPMDAAHQGSPFNMKTYGLVNRLLQNNIPVRWAIKAGKVKDAIDFSANAARIRPTAIPAANQDFRAGPFIVDEAYATAALAHAVAFGNAVAVYQTTADVTVDIRYEMTFKPKMWINTVNGDIHSDILDEAGIPDYVVSGTFAILAGSCFTLASEPHNDDPAGVAAVRSFVESGGNFLGQCRSVNTYENDAPASHLITTLGLADDNRNNALSYPNPDLSLVQFEGDINGSIGGSHRDWKLAASSVFKSGTHALATNVGVTPASWSVLGGKLYNSGRGGMVYYLGGHDFGGSTALNMVNGRRAYLNAVMTPPTRPAGCGLTILLPDLTLQKSHTGFVYSTDSVTYTLTVTNAGDAATVDTIAVRDTLPAGLTYLSASGAGWTFSVSGQVVTARRAAALGVGATSSFTILASVSAAPGTLLTNVGRASGGGEVVTTNNAATDTATVRAHTPQITVQKRHTAGFADGVNGTYTIVVRNIGRGPTTATVTATDTLPTGLSYVSGSGTGWSVGASGQVVTATHAAAIASGDSAIFTVTVGVGPSAMPSVINRARVATTGDTSAANNVSADTTAVAGTPNLTVQKRHTVAFVVGTQRLYTVVVRNVGSAATAGTITVRDTLPSGLGYVSGAGAGWSFSPSGQEITVTHPTSIAVGDSSVLTLTVNIGSAALPSVTNAATVSGGGDITPANNRATDPTTVTEVSDLRVTKSGPATVDALQNLVYTIVVTNDGPSAVSSVTIRDFLPAGVTFVSADNGGTHSAGVVTWPVVPSILTSGSVTRTVTVTAPASGTLINYARADAPAADPDSTNNNGSAAASRVTTTVVEQADLSVSKTGPATVNANQTFGYTITVTNNGSGAAANVVVRDTLPAGVTFVSASNGGTHSAGVVTWPTVASIANGGGVSRTVTVTAPATGTLVNVARVNSTTADPDTTNNNGSAAANRVTTTVVEQADVTVSKSGPATVSAAQTFSYTITVANTGPSTASGVVLRDTLPAGVTFVSASNGGTHSGGVVTWPSVATLVNGGSFFRTATVTAPATGTLVNVSRANAATADPDTTNNNGTAAASRVTTTVVEQADVAVSKTGPASVNSLQTFSYTITVTNSGPSSASSVVIRDTLPAGVAFVSASNGGTHSAGVVTWPAVASIANGGGVSRTVSVTAPATGTLVNVARANSTTADPDTTNNNGSAAASRVTTTVVEHADLAVVKTGPASVNAAQTLGYTLTVTNNGPSAASSVVIRDTLPAGVTFVTASNGGTESGGVVTWPSVASIANGANVSRTVTVTAPATGTLVNVARADAATADPDTTDNNGSAAANRVTTTVTEVADVTVSKSGPAIVTALQTFGYTITVTNDGPSAASGVVVRDTLPAGVTFVSASDGGTESGGVVTWPAIASIANGANVSRTVTVTAPVTGVLVNVARADAATTDPDTTNNNGTDSANRVTTLVGEQADLAVVKAGPATVPALGTFGYTITVTNNGPSTATSVVIRDTLPAGVTFVSASDGGTESGGVVTWGPVASIANGGNVSRTVTVTAPATGTLVNVARADAATADPDTTNNNGAAAANRVTTVVIEQADVEVSKAGPATVDAAATLGYTITVTNDGPSAASAVVIRDTLPAGVTFVSASDGGTESGGVVTWPAIASIANGANVARTVTVTAPATGTLVNVARAAAATADPDTTNNDGTAAANRVTTTVVEQADVAVSKTGPATVNAAQTFAYSITVTNNGPSTASSVVVRDTLPAGVTFVSASDGGTESGGVVTWPPVATIANGANVSRTVTVTAPATGTLVNVARADAATADPDTTNNNGSAAASQVTTTVTEQADVALSKSGPAAVNALQTFSYTLTATNDGPSAATSVVIRDTLPAGVTFVSASNGGTESGGVVTWPAIASIANGANVSRTVTVTAPATGTLVNVSRADAATADPDNTNNNGSDPANRVTTMIGEFADLAVTKSGPATVVALEMFPYSIHVQNQGPSDATAVVLRDTLPAGVTFVSASDGGTESGGVVTWPAVGTLGNGSGFDRTVTVTAPATGTLVNVARADAATADPDTTNNNGSDPANRVATTIGEVADLAVTKSGPATVAALETFPYSIHVQNQGPSDATAVVLRDTLPAGVTFVSASNGGTESGGVVTWPAVGTLGNGSGFDRTVTVTAPATGTLVNVARADAATADSDTTNNNGSDSANRVTTTVTEVADVTVVKSGPGAVTALQTFGYTLTVTNDGPSTATSVVVRDTLPAGVTFVSASDGGTESGGVVTWPAIASIANGANVSRTVTVTAPATGTLVNVARADAATADPDTTNNNGSDPANRVTTAVTEIADLAVAKSGPALVDAVQTFSYTLAVTNLGPSDAAGVVVRDTLPAGVTFVSASDGGTESGGVVTWPAIASIANGANVSRTVTVTAPATGTLVNVARADAATADPDTTNNDGTAAASRVTTTVTERADLEVVKTGPPTVGASQNLTYTITITNHGPSAAVGVVVRDTLPAGATFLAADNGGTESAGVVEWPVIASLADGASAVYTVTVIAPVTGTLLNVVGATAATTDPDLSNNDGSDPTSRVTTVVTEIADLRVFKSGPAAVQASDTFGYTVLVTNEGPSDATGVAVVDTLPAGVTFVSASDGGTESGGVVSWPVVASLPYGSGITRTVTVTAPGAGTLLNVAAASAAEFDPDPASNDGSAPASRVLTAIGEVADLALFKTGPASVNAAQTFTYTLTVVNAGPSDASAIVVRDTLPAGVTFVSASNGGTVSGGVVTWPVIASIANGGGVARTVTVTAPGSGPLLNVASLTAPTLDSNPGDNDGTGAINRVTTAVVEHADVSVAKSGPASATTGTPFSYTITVANAGPSNANTVMVSDTLPAEVTFVSASNGGTESGGVVSWPAIATLGNGASAIRTVIVMAAAPGTAVNVATASAATLDPDAANNDGSAPASRASTLIGESADVAVAKSGPPAVTAAQTFTYTIDVTNTGPSAAASVTIRDTLPAGVTFVSASDGGTESGGVVAWPPVATLANGGSVTRTVTVIAPATGTLLNVATAVAVTPDIDPANNDGSDPVSRVTTAVGAIADIAVVKTGPASVTAGQNLTYTIETANQGPSPATAVVVRDTLPAGATFVSASNGGTESGGVVTWPAIPSMPAATIVSYTVTITAPGTGPQVNVAVASAAEIDPDLSNNDGTWGWSRVTTVVNEIADLAVAKSGPATVAATQMFSYTIAVSNLGPSPASAVVVRDTLPAGVTFVSATDGGTESGGVVSWPAAGPLANGASISRIVTVAAPDSGTLVNVAHATSSTSDPDAANNDGTAAASRVTTTVAEQADVAVTKTGPATVSAVETFRYTIVATNFGPSAAADVVVRDTLPAGVTFVSADNGGTHSAGVVTWPAVAMLANGTGVTRTVTVVAPATGTLVNVATATGSTADPDPSDNDGSAAASRVTTTVGEIADVAVAKTGPATVAALGSITYTLTATNLGPSSASGVVLRDSLPAGVTFVSADNGGTFAGGIVTWPPIASLANGATATRTVTVIAPASGTLVNVARVTSGTPDPDPSNNDGTDPVNRTTANITESADLGVSKSGPAKVIAGGTLDYRIVVTNHGPSPAAGVVVRDTLPAGLAFISADLGGTEAGGVVTWPVVATLANGDSLVRTVRLTAPGSGSFLNLATANAATADPDPINNDGSSSISRVATTVAQVDLSISKTHAGSFTVGLPGTYTLTVVNVGDATTMNPVTVTDTLPAGLTFVSASGFGWNFSTTGSIVTATYGGSVGPDGIIEFTLVVDVDAAAMPSVTNSATVSSADDLTPGNDRSLDPATVTEVTGMLAEKRASRDEAEIADVVDYAVSVRNLGIGPVADLVIEDWLPPGFEYQPGSARFDGAPIADPDGLPGRSLRFQPGTLGSLAVGVLTYRAQVGPGATLGDGINRARASSPANSVASNDAAVRVRVRGGVFTDEGTVAGKIFLDCDCSPDSVQGAEELGVPGVRVVLEDGTAAITDADGKFHFTGISPRLHVLRIDRSTLPAGARALSITNRHAGDGRSQFVDLKSGELHRADFALRQTPDLLAQVIRRREAGEITEPGVPGFATAPVAGAAGAAGATGSTPATTAHGERTYQGLIGKGYESTASSLPLARRDSTGAFVDAPVRDAGPATAPPAAGNATAAAPSRLALGLLQGRLEFWNDGRGAGFAHRDRFEDELRDFSGGSDGGKSTAAGRGALFLTGPVAQDYRLTVRYDSENDERRRLFRDLRPDEHYPIYGDASVPEFGAQSRNRLFARIERDGSHLTYGDFTTGTASPLRMLGAFSRSLNGGLGHGEWAKGTFDAFASRGESRQVVDELPGLGVSGPYALRREGLANSERVEIVTRDRNRPSVVVRREPQQRFVDYSIEPFTGRIVFRRAVPSVDENLNPVSILVSYETETGGDPFWVFGAEGRVRPAPHLEVGASVVRDDDPLAPRTVWSASGAVTMGAVTAIGEVAGSDSASSTGEAARGELRLARPGLDLAAFGSRTGARFSNPSSGFGPGRTELGARGVYALLPRTRLLGEAIHSRDGFTRGRRTGFQIGLAQGLSRRLTGEIGFRASEETMAPADGGTAATPGTTPNETKSLRARLTGEITDRSSIFGEFEQDVTESSQRRAALGGDLRIASRTRLYARHELISSFAGPYALNPRQDRYATVVGLSSDDTRAGTVFSEYRLRDAIDGRTAQAAIGLRNRWTVQPGLHLDLSGERVSPLAGAGGAPATTALGMGLDYTSPPRWRGTTRLEWRRGGHDDQVLGSLGLAHKLGRDWAMLARSTVGYLDQNHVDARSQFGVAWRETDRNRWDGLARYEHRYQRGDGLTGDERRSVNIVSLHADRLVTRGLLLRGQAATRFGTVAGGGIESDPHATLLALRGTWDVHRRIDVGLIGRTLFRDGFDYRQDGVGAEIGFLPARNLRVAGGYNVFGYTDRELNAGTRSDRGFYFDLGFKFDEDVFRFLDPEKTGTDANREGTK